MSPWPLTFFFWPDWQLSNRKIWLVDDVLRWSFDRKLISPNVFRDVQKPLFDLFISQFVTVLAGQIWISFSSHKISLCSKSPHFNGATLNKFGCVYLTETHAQWSSHFCIWKREAVVVKVCNIGAMWSRQSMLFRKNIENCSMPPHLTVCSMTVGNELSNIEATQLLFSLILY